MLNCIDLFCGCGGLSLGFEKAGINVLVGIDAWKDAITTFNYNHKNSKGICADLSTLNPEEIEKELNGKTVDLIIGGPPCQGFSVAGKRIVDDERNKLYKNFVRFVEYYKPKAFMMENVPNILSIGEGIVRDSYIDAIISFPELGEKNIEEMTPVELLAFTEIYMANIIEARLVNDIGNKMFSLPENINEINDLQQQIKEYINGAVSDAVEKLDVDILKINSTNAKDIVESVYKKTYDILAGLEE